MSRGTRLSGELAIFPPLPSTGPEAPDDLESVQYKTRGTRYKRSCRSSRALRWIKFDGATGVLHKTTTGSWKSTYGWTDRADGLTVSFRSINMLILRGIKRVIGRSSISAAFRLGRLRYPARWPSGPLPRRRD